MQLDQALQRLAANSVAIAGLARDVSETQARWKPTRDDWSILEVICHLYDEEREDFRQRLDYLLHRPGDEFPPIDPEGWVSLRGYNQRDFPIELDAFLSEREASLRWLRSLQGADWGSGRVIYERTILAADMLGAWVAHDHLHIRQLNELHWKHLATLVAPISLDYGGGW
jgi:hypothetical protein